MSPRRRDSRMAAARLVLDVVLLLSVAGVVAATLLPSPDLRGIPARDVASSAVNLDPLHTIRAILRWGTPSQQFTNLLLNVVLFIPFGLAVGLKARTSRPVLVATLGGAALSALVEAGQFLLPLSRSTDIDDVILNSLGAALGSILAVVLLPGLRRAAHGPRPPQGRADSRAA